MPKEKGEKKDVEVADIIDLLNLVHEEAVYSYWSIPTNIHCGADFQPGCKDCRHYAFCESTAKIQELIAGCKEE